jgi:hypothetical protein
LSDNYLLEEFFMGLDKFTVSCLYMCDTDLTRPCCGRRSCNVCGQEGALM